MAIYPGANVRLIDTKYLSGKSIAVYNRVNLHVQAGTGSLFNFFNASGRASSHFWVSYGGGVEQYVDTKLQAEADLDGNDATISIETEGGTGSTADTDGWTQAQLDALAALCRWIMDTHGIPKKLAENSFSGNASSKGLSWHRLGIDGNFPALPDIRAGRKQRGGGMYYSSSTGKVCPGGGKIQQIPGILSVITGGAPVPPQPLPPEPPNTGGIAEDGIWGPETTRALQKLAGTEVDGEVWYQYKPNAQPAFGNGWVYNWTKGTPGSPLIRAMQSFLGVSVDGVWGAESTRALQARMGTIVDGELWAPSPAIAEMQRRLNTGDAATA